MIRYSFLAILAITTLIGCSDGNPYDSTVQTQDGEERMRLAAETPAFVEAKDGTLYSVDCLKTAGAKIAAGVANAGKECAAEKIDKTSARGIYRRYGGYPYFSYVNPVHYYGGNGSNKFCKQYFGYSWNGCYSWLGYTPTYKDTPYYYPECQECVFTQSGENHSSCPHYCKKVTQWNDQPWYQKWGDWDWLYLLYL